MGERLEQTGPATTHPTRLFLETDMSRGEEFPFAGGQVTAFTTRSPARETPNEDAAALIRFGVNAGILVVADGVGGSAAGSTASRIAVQCMSETIQAGSCDESTLRASMLNGIELANQRILETGTGASTTIAVILIEEGRIRSCHVGDSDILVVGGRGKIKHRTLAHGPVGYAVEAGLIDEGEAMHHEQRNEVSNVVGATDMRIEIGPSLELAPRDTVILASDGLYDNLFEDEIVERIRKGSLGAAAESLASTCLRRMQHPRRGEPHKPDDLTFLLFRPGKKT
jgi:serine/threonine protein phosphatase PrpC